MKFVKKIGGAFLLLTLLTAVAGGLGLYFTYRVLGVLSESTAEEEPLVTGIVDLSSYMRKAVNLSKEVAANDDIEDIRYLREELEKLNQDFGRIYTDAIQSTANETLLDVLDKTRSEHLELTNDTNQLINEHAKGIEATIRLQSAIQRFNVLWYEHSGALDRFLAQYRLPGQDHPFGEGEMALALLRFQQILMDLKFHQEEIINPKSRDRLAEISRQVKELFRRGKAELDASIHSAGKLPAGFSDTLIEIQNRFDRLNDAFFGSGGLTQAYGDWIAREKQLAASDENIKSKASDAIRVLDRLSSIAGRLTRDTKSTVIFKATPALLVITIVITLVLSLFLTAVFTRNFARPVEQLIDMTKAVAKGDFSYRIRIDSGDELDFLAKSFNYMIDEISHADEKIRKLNLDLEQRVSVRTAELENEIQEKKLTEHALKRSEEQYRTIIDNFPNGIVALINRDGKCLAIGGQALRNLDVDTADCGGKTFHDVWPSPFSSFLEQNIPAAFEGHKRSYEVSAMGSDWLVSMVPNFPHSSENETVTLLFVDVTEIKRAEREAKENQRKLIQADKLASLGILVAGVAHEINNPNQAILAGGELLRQMWKDLRLILDSYYKENGDFSLGGMNYSETRDTLSEYLSAITDSARRIESIVRSLKDYARQDQMDMNQRVDINAVVRSGLNLLSSMLKKSTAKLVVNLEPDLPTVRGNSQRLEQVAVNIIQNACQALENRNQGITISTGVDEAEANIVLQVCDEGIGIPAQDIDKIKDPFFTSKRSQGGTGLGLSVTSAIIQEHGGTLRISSEVNRGTTVTVLFPANLGPKE